MDAAAAEASTELEESTQVYRAPAAGGPGKGAQAQPQVQTEVGAAQSAAWSEAPHGHADARPLLGQDHVVRELARALESTLSTDAPPSARLLVVQAPPGAGKTRMLQRAGELAAGLRADVSLHYAALRSRDDGPYAPLSRLLLDRFGITPASSPAGVRRDMEAAAVDALGTEEGASTTAQWLGHIAGVPFPGSLLLREHEGDRAVLRAQAAAALARFAQGEARRRPSVWLLDDLTDAEESAWELLSALLELDVPLVIVASGRPPIAERAAALRRKERVQCVELSPLAANDIARLARALVPGLEQLPAELSAALMHRSSGNPRQLVELVRALEDGGLFRRTEHGVFVDLAHLERGELPLTMADSIRARLDTLGRLELQVIRDAAIVGERFWDGALLALQRAREPLPDAALSSLAVWTPSDDELALQDALDALEAKEFVVRIDDSVAHGVNEYSFNYAGTRSIVYAAVDEPGLKHGHALVARWLSTASGLAVESLAALVAPHLEHGGARERAAQAYLQAASDERARMRTTMALLYVDKALTLIDESELPTRIEALHQRGSLLSTLGRYAEALSAFEQIARLAWAIGARGRGAAALNRIARIHRERGEHEQGLEHLRGAMRLFDSVGDQRGLASCYDDMAQAHRVRGELDRALAAAKQALAIRVRNHDRRGQAVSLDTIGRIELDHGRYDTAEARFGTALKIREALADHEGAVQTRIALGQLAFRRGQHEAAVRIYLKALEGARELNHPRFQSYALHYLGVAHHVQNDLDRAESALRQAKKLAGGLRDQYGLAEIERNLAAVAQTRAERATKPS